MPKVTSSSSLYKNPGGGNPLWRWLKDRGFWVPAGAGASAPRLTHVFLNGGRASVPSSELEAFNAQYADAVAGGHPQYAVERPPPDGFRMFLDFDAKHLATASPGALGTALGDPLTASSVTALGDPPGASGTLGASATASGDPPLAPPPAPSGTGDGGTCERELAILRTVLQTAAEICPGLQGEAVVCMKHADPTRPGGTGTMGSMDGMGGGAHVVWTGADAVVSMTRARGLRDALVAACRGRQPSVPWEDLIDAAVYRNNGLRMMMSLKRGSPAAYVPSFLWRGGEAALSPIAREDVHADLAGWVQRTSLFSAEAEAARSALAAEATAASSAAADHPGEEGNREGGILATALESRSSLTTLDPEVLQSLRALLPEPYRSPEACRITSVRASAETGSYVLFTDSRHCMNLGRAHSSNHIYLVANRHGLFQRCFCTCDTTGGGRVHGRCRDLNLQLSDTHPLPPLQPAAADARRGTGGRMVAVPSASSMAGAWLERLDQRLARGTQQPNPTASGKKKKKTRKPVQVLPGPSQAAQAQAQPQAQAQAQPQAQAAQPQAAQPQAQDRGVAM